MGTDTDDAIKHLIVEKVKAQLSIVMKEDEIKELVIEELAQFQMEESSQRRKLKEWVKEELHKRIREIISQELTNPEYVGTTWGDAGTFWKQIIKENADDLVGAMFARVLDEAKTTWPTISLSRCGEVISRYKYSVGCRFVTRGTKETNILRIRRKKRKSP